jgi:hypothetical protein
MMAYGGGRGGRERQKIREQDKEGKRRVKRRQQQQQQQQCLSKGKLTSLDGPVKRFAFEKEGCKVPFVFPNS